MKTLEGDYHAAICKAGGISGDNADDFNKVSARCPAPLLWPDADLGAGRKVAVMVGLRVGRASANALRCFPISHVSCDGSSCHCALWAGGKLSKRRLYYVACVESSLASGFRKCLHKNTTHKAH